MLLQVLGIYKEMEKKSLNIKQLCSRKPKKITNTENSHQKGIKEALRERRASLFLEVVSVSLAKVFNILNNLFCNKAIVVMD